MKYLISLVFMLCVSCVDVISVSEKDKKISEQFSVSFTIEAEYCRWIGTFDFIQLYINLDGETYLSEENFKNLIKEKIEEGNTNYRKIKLEFIFPYGSDLKIYCKHYSDKEYKINRVLLENDTHLKLFY